MIHNGYLCEFDVKIPCSNLEQVSKACTHYRSNSTFAVPDFRSGMDTKVETGESVLCIMLPTVNQYLFAGPGKWELQAYKATRSAAIKVKDTTQAIPTPTHMMLVKLVGEGLLKAVISQNTDGMHRRSGLPVKSTWQSSSVVYS